MTTLSRNEFDSFIQNTLPDNSSRQISASDLRQSFINLADSIQVFNNDIYLNSLNFGDIDNKTVFVGTNALSRKGVNGFYSENNTALGYSSLNTSYLTARNTSIGSYSLFCNSLGCDNVAVGFHSLGGTTTGSGNIGIGNYTMMKNKHGQFNIIIGHGAGYNLSDNEDFKFILGAYPQASGDCDDLAEGLDNPPLLYGDLNSLQLAIGISDFRGSEKLSVSGHIYPYEDGIFSLGNSNYRWNTFSNSLDVEGTIRAINPFHEFDISADAGSSSSIASGDTIIFTGLSGIATAISEVNSIKTLGFSAAPISGWVNHQLNSISGYASAFNGPSGLVWNVSGWAGEYAESLSIAAGAYTHWIITDDFGNSDQVSQPGDPENTIKFKGISGIQADYRTDNHSLEISAHPISGWADETIEVASGWASSHIHNMVEISGYAVSGWAHEELNDISGYASAFNGPSGLVWNVSGWNAAYSSYLDGLTRAKMEDDDGKVGASLSGYAEHLVEISGYAVSGWSHDQLNLISGYAPAFNGPSGLAWNVSGWARGYVDATNASSNAYTHWYITDGVDMQEIQAQESLHLSGVEGISTNLITNPTSPAIEISAEPISGILISYSEDISGVFRSEIVDIEEPTNGTIDTRIETFRINWVDFKRNELSNSIFKGPTSLSGVLYSTIESASGYNEELSSIYSGVLQQGIQNLSGVMIHDFYDRNDGRLHNVSGNLVEFVNKRFTDYTQDLQIGEYGEWRVVSDDNIAGYGVGLFETVKYLGKDGITTSLTSATPVDVEGVLRDQGPHVLTIDSAPLSGYINSVSGLLDSTLRTAITDSGIYYSGILHHIIDSSGVDLIDRINASGYAISGALDGYISDASGALDSFIDDTSGVLYHTIIDSGRVLWDLIQLVELNNDNYLHWSISDGTTSRDIRALESVQFLGISGIETVTKTDGASGIYISARPLSGILYETISNSGSLISGVLDSFITDLSGIVIHDFWANGGRGTGIYNLSAEYTNNKVDGSGVVLIDRMDASGYAISGALDGYIYDASGALDSFIDDNNSRASGLINHISGILTTTAGSGLVKLENGEFNTAGSGNFEKLILQKTDAGLLNPVGQILADSGDGYNIIVNSNGYLQMPAVSEYEDLPSASDYGNSGVAFVDSNIYHSDGVSWSKPLTIEGFMEEDLDPPTDFLSPISGKLVTRIVRNGVFQTGNTEYVTNRDHTFAASGGYYLMAMRVNNEYRPIWSTCSGCPVCP